METTETAPAKPKRSRKAVTSPAAKAEAKAEARSDVKVPWLVQVLNSFKDGEHTYIRVFVLMFLVTAGLVALYLAPHVTAGGGVSWLAIRKWLGA